MSAAPTMREALGDTLTALVELVHALGPALTPTQARSLRRIHSGLAGLVLDVCMYDSSQGERDTLVSVGVLLDASDSGELQTRLNQASRKDS